VTVPQEDGRDLDGYVRQDRLWGVYPNEKVE
jgi:SH3-like domain-containing protein